MLQTILALLVWGIMGILFLCVIIVVYLALHEVRRRNSDNLRIINFVDTLIKE